MDEGQIERRQSPRRPYSQIAYVAPCESDGTVCSDELQSVECQDISRGGIAFLLTRRPNFEQVVITLPMHDQWASVRARVIYYQPVTGRRGGFLVGCKFLERISIDLDKFLPEPPSEAHVPCIP